MAKKGKGLFPFIVGLAAGAAAVFFSKEENRAKAKRGAKKAVRKGKTIARKASKKKTTKKA